MISNGWLKIVHGSCCDSAALERIVDKELQTAAVVRIMEAAPRGDALEFWRQVGGAVGPSAPLAAYGAPNPWMEGTFELNGRATPRGGDITQPLHNDGASVAELAGAVGLFYVERQGQGGGQSLFVDVGTIADCARRYDPMLFDRLFDTPIAFGRPGGATVVSPILRQHGERLKIAWNDFRILPGQGEAVEETRRAFRLFLLDMTLSGDVAALKLQTGDALFFRADEVLHGRAAYAVRGSGESTLWKTYFQGEPERVSRAA